MPAPGWIRLHRKIYDHWLWREPHRFSKFEAWIDLLLQASYQDQIVVFANRAVELKRGSLVTTERYLSKRWGWARNTVKHFICDLKIDHMLNENCTTHYTTLTIVNYDFYQGDYTTEGPRVEPQNEPRTEPDLRNKEIKKIKKRSPPIIPPVGGDGLFERFWQAYPKKKSKGQAEKAWLAIKPDEQLLAAMLAMIERAKTSAQWARDNGQYIPYPATWLNAKGWLDESEVDKRGTSSASAASDPAKAGKYAPYVRGSIGTE